MIFSKIKNYLIGFLIISIIALSGYLYFLKDNLEQQKENVQKLKDSLTSQEKLIEEQTKSVEKSLEIKESLNESRKIEFRKVEKLEKKFDKRDFSYLAYKKPKLIENIINEATQKRTECYDIITDTWNSCSDN